MDPCQAALSIVKELREAGFQAYLVGGCVRDRLLGKEPEDYDVCTDARPDQVEALFPRTIATGIRHGTVTVIAAGHPVEVTTFRVEGAYRDGRRPDHVRFVGRVEEDLARRDFTINAMAQDPEGAIIDPFGGRRDLERRVIRTVGAAEDRFREDALRMVRAVRLAAQLEFSLHPETEAAIRRMAPDLARLSVERVTQELEKVWKARRPSRAVASLFRLGMMKHLPPFHRWDLPSFPRPPALDALDGAASRRMRWALLLHLCGQKPEEAAGRLKELRLPRRDAEEIGRLYRSAAAWPSSLAEEEGKRRIFRDGIGFCREALELSRRMGVIDEAARLRQVEALNRWNGEMPIRRWEELAVNGKDLIDAAGRPAGPWVGRTLRILADAVILGRLPNDHQLLIEEGVRIGRDATADPGDDD
jgi:tRNA nucleotidyltransferase (CCA-adding enzyme)